MASIITLDGPVGATNEYGEEIPTVSPAWGELAKAFLTYGVLAFAVGTAAYRAGDWMRSSRPVKGVARPLGRRRRRRR